MKGFKKLLTGILAATMIMGSSMTVFATEGTTAVTITRSSDYAGDSVKDEDGKEVTVQKYTYYKILSADVASDGVTNSDTGKQTGVAASYYAVGQDQMNALNGIFNFNGATTVDGETRYYVTGLKDGLADQALASAIKTAVDAKSSLFPGVETNNAQTSGTTQLNIPSDGYYLISSELGSNMIIQTVGETAISIKEKNEYPTIDKLQQDITDNKGQINSGRLAADATTTEFANLQVGDIVEYTIKVNVPANTNKEITVTDTMSAGLEFASGIKVDGTETIAQSSLSGKTFTVTIPENTGDAKTSTITYQARITDAALSDSGKKNEVTLDYGEYHQYDYVPYNIYKAGVHKYDGSTNASLEGVEFAFYVGGTVGTVEGATPLNVVKQGDYYVPTSAQGASNTVATDANGVILIRGLDTDKTYWVYETKTKPGYNMPVGTDRYKQLTLKGDSDTLEAAGMDPFVNNTGATLPSTGGIGTTIFYIIGGLLIVAAVVFFVVRRKNDAE